MGDEGKFWRDARQAKKERKERSDENRFNHADKNDDGKWIKHTNWHWSRKLKGKRLDYWPTKSKFSYDGGKVQTGNVFEFIKKNETEEVKDSEWTEWTNAGLFCPHCGALKEKGLTIEEIQDGESICENCKKYYFFDFMNLFRTSKTGEQNV